MFGNITENEDVGYVSKFPTGPFTFPVSRPLQINVYPHDGKYYFKTNDVAALLGIKQQFQFTKNIKEMLGTNAILKYKKTEAFRDPADEARTTFIEGKDLYFILVNSDIKFRNRLIPGMYIKVVEALRHVYG